MIYDTLFPVFAHKTRRVGKSHSVNKESQEWRTLASSWLWFRRLCSSKRRSIGKSRPLKLGISAYQNFTHKFVLDQVKQNHLIFY